MQRRMFLGAALTAPSGALLAAGRPAAGSADSSTRGRYPNVLLTTHEGKRLRFYDDVIQGNRVNIINMMYTQCPEVCGGTVINLERVQRLLEDRLGKDVLIWSITLAPRQDSPAVLRRYAELVGAGPHWKFLTGRHIDIERIRRALGYVDLDPVVDKDLNTHSGMLRMGNDALDRWIACPGMAEADSLAQEALWIGLAHRA